jgi:hypothetical protein
MAPAIGVLQNSARNSSSAKTAPSAVFRIGALSFGLWCTLTSGPDSGIGAAADSGSTFGRARAASGFSQIAIPETAAILELDWSMIRKSGYRFSEKIMLKQKDRAGGRLEEKSSRSSGGTIVEHSPRVHMKLMQAREITPHVWAHPDEDR